MKTPEYLKKGDTIAVVSTARKISLKELQPSLEFIGKWGLKIVLGETIDSEEHQFAGSDEFRTKDFQRMLDDPKIKAIWCAKGGYGTVRIIDNLDFSQFKNSPKWIIGYSDITVLHSHIHNMGVETLHAQTLLGIENKTAKTEESIKKVLFGKEYSIESHSQTEKESESDASRKNTDSLTILGTVKGELVGGNLSILYSLCGSNSSIKTIGKILFIEDLDEYLYHVDRMVMNLKRNGLLDNLAGLIVGGMTDMNDNTVPYGKSANEIIYDAVKEYNYPVCFNFPAGHIEDNRALIMGRSVELDIQEAGVSVKFLKS